MPGDLNSVLKFRKMSPLLVGEMRRGFHEVKFGGGKKFGMMEGNCLEEVVGEESAVGSLLAEEEGAGPVEGGMEFVGLAG